MTGYVIRSLTAGTYLDIRDKGIVRHVDRIEDARQFEFATSAAVAADHLELDPATYEVVPAEEPQP